MLSGDEEREAILTAVEASLPLHRKQPVKKRPIALQRQFRARFWHERWGGVMLSGGEEREAILTAVEASLPLHRKQPVKKRPIALQGQLRARFWHERWGVSC